MSWIRGIARKAMAAFSMGAAANDVDQVVNANVGLVPYYRELDQSDDEFDVEKAIAALDEEMRYLETLLQSEEEYRASLDDQSTD